MARAVWKGALVFGVVNIPIEVFTATRDHRPRFHLLHATDETPVRYERVCEADGKPVAWADLVKGYEYARGRFVVLTKDDFRTAAIEKTKTIDIIDFVDPGEIDERYFETPYYLQPGAGADRAYVLLREALRAAGRLGVAKMILRDSQHLAGVEAIGDALVLTMMRFSDELAPLDEFRFPANADIRPGELKMARQLIASLDAKWNPGKYTDEYKENLMRVIHAKVKGRSPKLIAEDHLPTRTDVVALMTRLRASLAAGKRSGSTRRPAASKPRKGAGRPRRVA
jgi:DNA end-binding protein Ku